MREERGQIPGDVVVFERYDLWGSIGGNVRVVNGGKFYLRGTVYGNLEVEYGGRVHIFGQIRGNVTLADNTKLIHSGVIGGSVTNNGGRLFIEKASKIAGKLKTISGETKHETDAPPPPPLPNDS